MQIHIKSDGLPIYQQIADQIRHRIIARQLEVGNEMPSIRNLAQLLRVNPNTIARAYRELELEGLLEKRRTKGTFVASHKSNRSLKERIERLQPHLDAVIIYASQLGFSKEELVDQIKARDSIIHQNRSATEEGLS
ncbi:MAG: GntR family transcriptional regulator [Rubripirellula sp.]|nr:GntR family transcriptional regulator [Rubripirellula sp.]